MPIFITWFTILVNNPYILLGGWGALAIGLVLYLRHPVSQRAMQTYAYAAALAHQWYELGDDAMTVEHKAIEAGLAYLKEHQPDDYTAEQLSAFVGSVLFEYLHDADKM